MNIKDIQVGEYWFVQLAPRATLSQFKILEITAKTALMEQVVKIKTNHDISRYRLSDIEFIEQIRP